MTALVSYYNAINRREFERAYSYWFSPPMSFDQFSAGFAETAAARLIVGPLAVPASDYAPIGVPAMLLAWLKDGTEQMFYGCFYMHGEPVTKPARWYIYDASLKVAPTADLTLLQGACDPLQSVLEIPTFDYGDQPVDVVFSYYNAIVQRDFARAYGYWEAPPKSYEDFVAGFADTASAFVAVIPPEFIEGAVGSQYAGIPTFILAEHHDGSRPTFVGCFVTRRPNPDMIGEVRPWRLYSADVRALPGGSTDAHVLLEDLCP